MVVFVCGVSMYHGSILNSTLLTGGPSGRTRKTCFYPWKACPSHKVLNPRVPVKGERTGYKLRNGMENQIAGRPRPFKMPFVLAFSLFKPENLKT